MAENALLNHIEHVDISPISWSPDSGWLHLRNPDGYSDDVSVKVSRDPGPDGSILRIWVDNDKTGEQSDYSIDESGNVVRHDFAFPKGGAKGEGDDASATSNQTWEVDGVTWTADGPDTEFETNEIGEVDEAEIFQKNMQKFNEWRANERANQELEKTMGLDGQPVGLVEIEKLEELLQSAQPYDYRSPKV